MSEQVIGWLMMAPVLIYFAVVGVGLGVVLLAEFSREAWWKWAIVAVALVLWSFGAPMAFR